MPSKVISTLNDFRKDTLNREKDSMLLMTRRWKGVEDALMPQIDALSRDIDALRAAGKDVTPGKLYRMERYKALLAQARNETGKYEGWAGRQIEQGQREYFELGNAAARTMLKDLLPPGVNIDFNRLPVDAANNMIGLCKDGSPLFDVLKKRALFPEAVDGLTTQLINAMALGWNPRKTARAMADGLAAGLNKALVIARTEQLRAYREATYQNYKANNDIVNGWVWHSACDARTCAACWSMHGSVHSLDERLDDHVCGRCAMIPQTKSWSELGYTGIPDTNPVVPSGEDVFSKLSEEKQRGILGNTRFQMYKDGTLDFGKLATFTDDKVWGRTLRVAKVGEAKDNILKIQSGINGNTIVSEYISKIDNIDSIDNNDSRLSILAKKAKEDLINIDRNRQLSDTRDFYKYLPSDKLAELKNDFAQRLDVLNKRISPYTYRNESIPEDLKNMYDQANARYNELKRETKYRMEWYDASSRLAAASKASKEGTFIIERGEMDTILSKVHDVYRESGAWNGKGKPEYMPELFKTSDLSGAKLRYYIEFPDGRIGHPDEVHQARSRGRLIVVDKISIPNRDWTIRY